eukprot:GHVH01006091.1.p1 GENE.GHVH01006091.1~~GHVH01006091.1.p1  ORF type:complete len:956 (+),score=138.46 GHVH01006091.1:64-2931(+)
MPGSNEEDEGNQMANSREERELDTLRQMLMTLNRQDPPRAGDELSRERRREMRRNRRRGREVHRTEPVNPEDARVSVTQEDGTIVEREMTEAERYLHSHLDRVRTDYIEGGNLEREIQDEMTRVRLGGVARTAEDTEDAAERRRRMISNLVVLISMIMIAFILFIDDEDDSISGYIPTANDMNLRGVSPDNWFDTADGVSVYYRGMPTSKDVNRPILLELDSRGSSIPGVRLLTIEIRFDPPLPFSASVDHEIDASSLYWEETDFYTDGLDLQGLHLTDENWFFANGRGTRLGLFETRSEELPSSASAYDLYLQSLASDSLIRSSYYKDSYEKQLSEYPDIMDGSYLTENSSDNAVTESECIIYMQGTFNRTWDDTIVANPNFAQTTGSGKGMIYPESAHSVQRRKSITETNVVNQLKWRRLEPDDSKKHSLQLDIRSPNCPKLNETFTLDALDMKMSANLVLIVIAGLFIALAVNAYQLQKFIWMTENDDNSNQRLKVNISSLILNVLLGGFEAGLLFAFGLESALYVPLFVILAVAHTFCTILMMVRLTVQCWRTQMTRRVEAMRSNGEFASSGELQEACRNEANAFVRVLTVSCASGLLLATHVFLFMPELFTILYLLLWVPQIYSDVKIGSHKSLPIGVIIPTTLTRAYLPMLIWSLPSLGPPLSPQPLIRTPFDGIILPIIPRSPSRLMSFIIIGGLLCQMVALTVGHCLGPRWWVPLAFLPELHDYGRPPRLPNSIKPGHKKKMDSAGGKLKVRALASLRPGAIQSEAYGHWFQLKSMLWGKPAMHDDTDPTSVNHGGIEFVERSAALAEEVGDDHEDEEDGDHEDEDEDCCADGVYRQECVICMVDVEIPIAQCRSAIVSNNLSSFSSHEVFGVLSDKALSWLPLFLYTLVVKRTKWDPDANVDLPIEIVPWALTPCEHVFHEECLKEWCEVKMECPTCRSPIPNFIR